MSTATLVTELYEPRIDDSRRLLREHPTMRELVEPTIDPLLLERFLIQFSALAVQMTEPVEGWIRRAGERCITLGLHDIGRSLVKHASHEGGHHLMLIDDARLLVERWNRRQAHRLDAEQLLAQPSTPAIRAYVSLHEDTIAGDMPYGQVAIELEIERMSTTFGPAQMSVCTRVLGPNILGGLSFIKEHVALDVGHTALNERIMERLLALRPDAAEKLADIGSRAIAAYIAFFTECLESARVAVAQIRSRPARISA